MQTAKLHILQIEKAGGSAVKQVLVSFCAGRTFVPPRQEVVFTIHNPVPAEILRAVNVNGEPS